MTIDNPVVSPDASSLSEAEAALSLRYQDVIHKLIEPLPSHLIKVRPGATTKDKKSAIALAYYDWRIMVNRLNRLVGGENWYARLQPWGDHKIICTLTILGVSKDSSGEGEAEDENDGTSAEQQAKKRAMAEHGLNYLYLLPQTWGEYDAVKKRFVNPQALVEEMYRKARIEGLDLLPYISSARKVSGRRASTPPAASTSTGSSTSVGSMTPTEPTTEKAASTPPVDDKLIQDIQRMCVALGEAEPDYTTLTPERAQQLRNQLFNKLKATRARGAAVPASTH